MTAADQFFREGLRLQRAGALAESAAALHAALAARPNWAEAHYDLANTLRALDKAEEAARHYRQALRLNPAYLPAQVNLANLLRDQGKLDQAESAFRRALRTHPTLPELHNNLGTVLRARGNLQAAEAAFRDALKHPPTLPQALQNLAELLEPRTPAEAASLFGRVLAANPTHRGALEGLARARRALRDFPAATEALRRLADLHPTEWAPHHDLGCLLRDQGNLAGAEAAILRARALAPPDPAVQALIATSLGNTLRDLGRLPEAEAELSAAREAAPKLETARYGLAITRLTAGRLAEGFADFDARFVVVPSTRIASPRWLGGPIAGKRLLIAAEQGLGDTIQFARYVPRLAETGARLILQVQPTLAELMGTLAGGAKIVPAGPPPPHEAHVSLLDLPALLGQGVTARPVPIPYLQADPERARAWRAWLGTDAGLCVGIAWSGNPDFYSNHLRSLPAARMAELACPGVRFVSLQKGHAPPPDLAVLDAAPLLHGMADTAALIAALDLVISVDTSVVHLAGALGRPVWVLHRFDPCWRWGAGGEACIWYPTLRQFRPPAPGDWTSVLARARAELGGLVERKGVLF
jgi:Flp pilus assembly protein TadD